MRSVTEVHIAETVTAPSTSSVRKLRTFLLKAYPFFPTQFVFILENGIKVNQALERRLPISSLGSNVFYKPFIAIPLKTISSHHDKSLQIMNPSQISQMSLSTPSNRLPATDTKKSKPSHGKLCRSRPITAGNYYLNIFSSCFIKLITTHFFLDNSILKVSENRDEQKTRTVLQADNRCRPASTRESSLFQAKSLSSSKLSVPIIDTKALTASVGGDTVSATKPEFSRVTYRENGGNSPGFRLGRDMSPHRPSRCPLQRPITPHGRNSAAMTTQNVSNEQDNNDTDLI